MSYRPIDFGSQAWEPGAHSLERKKAASDGVTLLELAPGFEDPNWCPNGHAIYVIEGILELILRDRTETVSTGNACVLDPRTEHRARNPGSRPVRLFVVSRAAD